MLARGELSTIPVQALRSFSAEDQRAFLRFVTSVSRGPLLGFRYLEPPLCIQVAFSYKTVMSPHSSPAACCRFVRRRWDCGVYIFWVCCACSFAQKDAEKAEFNMRRA